MKDRDIVVLKKIVKYSNEINETIVRFDLDLDKFQNDHVMKNAICMCILQIGELANNLTDEFKTEYSKIPWRNIIAVRNRAAHAYETTDTEMLWKIVLTDIPELKTYCENIIEEKEKPKEQENNT